MSMLEEAGKKEKPMTVKRFMKLSFSGKATSDGMIAAHRQFLENHEFVQPILMAYDAGEILPTPCLITLNNLLFTHYLESEVARAEKKIAATIEKFEKAPKDKDGKVVSGASASGNYLVSLMVKQYDENDNVIGVELGQIETVKIRQVEKNGKMVDEKYLEIKPAIWGADDFMSAQNLADRRLFDHEDSVYAVIENTQGKRIETQIHRGDSIARLFRKPKSATCTKPRTSTSTLKWQPKCVQSRSVRVTS